jgi:hypothetical protein
MLRGMSPRAASLLGLPLLVAAPLGLLATTACKDGTPSRYEQFPRAGDGDRGGAARPTEAVAWPALDEDFLTTSAATMKFRLGVPAPLAIAPDGAVLFRRTGARERVSDLYQLPPTGEDRKSVV